MKYKAIIETDDYKDFEFFEDGNGKYMVGKDAGTKVGDGWIPLYFTESEQETAPFDFELYQAGLMDMPKEMIEVLDKIRAEIEARLCDVVSDYTDGYRTAIQGTLAIIDKYRKEQE